MTSDDYSTTSLVTWSSTEFPLPDDHAILDDHGQELRQEPYIINTILFTIQVRFVIICGVRVEWVVEWQRTSTPTKTSLSAPFFGPLVLDPLQQHFVSLFKLTCALSPPRPRTSNGA